jgi:hypothetical protein
MKYVARRKGLDRGEKQRYVAVAEMVGRVVADSDTAPRPKAASNAMKLGEP